MGHVTIYHFLDKTIYMTNISGSFFWNYTEWNQSLSQYPPTSKESYFIFLNEIINHSVPVVINISDLYKKKVTLFFFINVKTFEFFPIRKNEPKFDAIKTA